MKGLPDKREYGKKTDNNANTGQGQEKMKYSFGDEFQKTEGANIIESFDNQNKNLIDKNEEYNAEDNIERGTEKRYKETDGQAGPGKYHKSY
jgi:hypothetical protein